MEILDIVVIVLLGCNVMGAAIDGNVHSTIGWITAIVAYAGLIVTSGVPVQ